MNKKSTNRECFYLFLFFLSSLSFVSCKDDNYYYDKEPDHTVLGESIYDWLHNAGNFTNYLRIVESVQDAGTNYKEVLKVTGTKTVFVANDAAFEAFYDNNPYGIRRFEDFSVSQRRAIFFSCMLNDAYLIEMLPNLPGANGAKPTQGLVLRRTTSWALLDSIPFEQGDQLPANPYWEQYKEAGIHILKDNTPWPMVHFLEPHMRIQGISGEDFKYLTKTKENPAGLLWDRNAAYIFDTKVIQKDIICKNGYINVLEKVVFPVNNMAEHIRNNEDTRLFSRFLDRFCAPYYDAANTNAYRELNPDFSGRIYTKRFVTAAFPNFPDENGMASSTYKADGFLKFDPGKNDYSPNSISIDMGAMFIPTDKALNEYFNEGGGLFLKERYGSWDNVPDDVLALLINNHMMASFMQSTPERFNTLENAMGTSLNIKKEDLQYSAICNNGVVYVVDKVYPPSDYASVMAPVIVNEATKIMLWAVNNLNFRPYLLSLESRFSFIVPTDNVFDNYINPMSVGRSVPERWRFYMRNNNVAVTRYNMEGDSIGVIIPASPPAFASANDAQTLLFKSVLLDILDNHIVVGDIEDGKEYYQTKGGATIKVSGRGASMQLDGGGNKEQGNTVSVTAIYPHENGKAYFVDKMLQCPLNSVFSVVSSEEKFSAFFTLCQDVYQIRYNDKFYGGVIFRDEQFYLGITQNVSFFNTYHYTVYVPTNEAMQKAHAEGRYKTVDEIEILDIDEQLREMQKLYEFLRFHFQDNSVYIGGKACSNEWFETACMDLSTNKFRRLWVTSDASGMTVSPDEHGNKATYVITSGDLYNIMVRDYKFSTPAGNITANSPIATSSFAVIHQINSVLDFQ